MTSILFASVVRVRDGLPLSESTDFYQAPDFLACRRQLRTLASRLSQHPGGRGSAESHHFSIYISCAGGVACLGICSLQCSAARAFCFLETLWWEFTTAYDATRVGLASRPYTFLEFDSIIQKTKWHFNCVSSPQLRSSVDKIHEELQIQPPAILTLQDTDSANSTLANGQPPVYSEPAPNFRMEPVSALGILSLVLNIMCAALNLIRGVHLAEHALQVTLEEIGHILAFLIPFAACAFQCYLYLVYSPARRAKAALLLLSICLGNAYLHGLRNLWQILFHVGVAVLSSHQILSRRPRSARADCGV
ncbi:vesicle-trafficking protein SEC22c isoform 1-T3 [Thomomys bottae]